MEDDAGADTDIDMEDAHTHIDIQDVDDDTDMGGAEASARPTRTIKKPDFEGYVDSGKVQIDDSSPPMISSGLGSETSSIGLIPRNEGFQPEDMVHRLASCVIRHILYHYPPQNTVNLKAVIEFRDEKKSAGMRAWRRCQAGC